MRPNRYFTYRFTTSSGMEYLNLCLMRDTGYRVLGSWNIICPKDYGVKWRKAMKRMDEHWNNSINKLNARLQER